MARRNFAYDDSIAGIGGRDQIRESQDSEIPDHDRDVFGEIGTDEAEEELYAQNKARNRYD